MSRWSIRFTSWLLVGRNKASRVEASSLGAKYNPIIFLFNPFSRISWTSLLRKVNIHCKPFNVLNQKLLCFLHCRRPLPQHRGCQTFSSPNSTFPGPRSKRNCNRPNIFYHKEAENNHNLHFIGVQKVRFGFRRRMFGNFPKLFSGIANHDPFANAQNCRVNLAHTHTLNLLISCKPKP